MNRNECCAFTGSRPQKLPWGFNENDDRCIDMKRRLRLEILKAIEQGKKTFICGMALGFDTICAETVLELKKQYPFIKLGGALPCKNQDALWKDRDKERYRKLLEHLDFQRCIYDFYIGKECMMERNRYMVDSCSLLIALYGSGKGGTKATLDYAKTKSIEIVVINPLLPMKKSHIDNFVE